MEADRYRATIDEQVPAVDLRAMQKQNIFLVVPSRLKRDILHYQTAKNVITFEDFLSDTCVGQLLRLSKKLNYGRM
jgi:hypothetical protein